MRPVLHLDPMFRPASLIRPIPPLRHQTLQSHPAGGAKQVRPDLALLERCHEDAVWPSRQQAVEVGLAHRQRQGAQIVTIERQDVESVELDLVLVPAAVQRVEVGDAVDPEHYRLAVDHELTMADFQRGLDDPRLAVGPVGAALGDQAHPVAVALQPQPVAVVLNLVQPVRGVGDRGGFGGEAEFEGAGHANKIGTCRTIANPMSRLARPDHPASSPSPLPARSAQFIPEVVQSTGDRRQRSTARGGEISSRADGAPSPAKCARQRADLNGSDETNHDVRS